MTFCPIIYVKVGLFILIATLSHIYIYIYIRLNTSNCYLRFDVISQPCSKCSFDPLSRHGLQGQDALEEQMDKDFGFCIDEDCFQVFHLLKIPIPSCYHVFLIVRFLSVWIQSHYLL